MSYFPHDQTLEIHDFGRPASDRFVSLFGADLTGSPRQTAHSVVDESSRLVVRHGAHKKEQKPTQ
jgi:hypothetical protein